MKVFVYYNLHSGKWSVKALEGVNKGLVVAHADKVKLMQVSARISEKGRQRVLREKQKNIHAGLVGNLAAMEGAAKVKGRDLPACLTMVHIPQTFGEPISYNPYKAGYFYYKETGEKYLNSAFAFMLDKTVNVY